jgi:hypothetical protein
MLGANQVSQTRQRSILKWIRARPTIKGRSLSDLLYVPSVGKMRNGKHTFDVAV